MRKAEQGKAGTISQGGQGKAGKAGKSGRLRQAGLDRQARRQGKAGSLAGNVAVRLDGRKAGSVGGRQTDRQKKAGRQGKGL